MAMRHPNEVKNFVVSIDGIGQEGLITEFEPPEFKNKLNEHLAGGMGSNKKINSMVLEDLELSFKTHHLSAEIEQLIGVLNGGKTKIRSRESLNDDESPTTTPVFFLAEGTLNEVKYGSRKVGDRMENEYKMSVITHFEHYIGGVEERYYDYSTHEYRIHGVSQWASQNSDLGID